MATFTHAALTDRIIGAAIEVHRGLDPGLLESAYRECLAQELLARGVEVEREKSIPITYRGRLIPNAFRADLVVEGKVLVELKAIERFLPIHQAQALTYLRLSGLGVALLLNFNAITLKDGIKRFVL